MKKLIFLLLPIYLLLPINLSASSPFESPTPKQFDLSMFNTGKKTDKTAKNVTIECKYVCKEKRDKEQTIAEAISFYKTLQK